MRCIARRSSRSVTATAPAYYDRKLAEGKTPREAIRALKRRLSDIVWRHLIADAQHVTTS